MEIVWDDVIIGMPGDLKRMFKQHEDKLNFETKYQLALALPFAEENGLHINAVMYSLRIAQIMMGMDKLLLYRRAIRHAEKLRSSPSLYIVAYGHIVDYLEQDKLVNTDIYKTSKNTLEYILNTHLERGN
ncbi:hypothetical protein KO465_06445 [Candidatus Micrarchaeota archaeon]|jgi:hypothetical protein|nr:hypothetical protein [Candidatus Micrarchaeota archaeon]